MISFDKRPLLRWTGRICALTLTLLLGPGAQASLRSETIYSLHTGQEITLTRLTREMTPGTVVILSEHHGNEHHHQHQIDFLLALRESLNKESRISLGMEFLYFPDQAKVDDYLAGTLNEEAFLNQIKWGDIPFTLYRQQVHLPRTTGGRTLAINAPPWLTSKIAQQGLEALTPREAQFLPPDFLLGEYQYFQRFSETMRENHLRGEAVMRYFYAQSVWDDTMAWRAAEHMKSHPRDVLVIIVGDFHAIYGDGLPARLRARGLQRVITVGQVDLELYTPGEEDALLQPHPRWGARADYLWTSRSPKLDSADSATANDQD